MSNNMLHIPVVVGGQHSEKFLKPTLVNARTYESKRELIYCIDIHRVFILAHPRKICEFTRKKLVVVLNIILAFSLEEFWGGLAYKSCKS